MRRVVRGCCRWLRVVPDQFVTLGFSAASWIEHYLVHGPGDVQGLEIELDDEFLAFIAKAYRLDGRGGRRIRRAFLSRAKGRNKSGLAAMLACFEALGPCRFSHFAGEGEVSDWGYEYEPGEPVGKPVVYAEVLCVATEEGQAGNTYDAIYYMLHPETCSPELLSEYGRLDVGLARINLPQRRGFIEPVTSSDSSNDGGKSTFIVADETHLWLLPRLRRLHRVMARNLLKRKVASGWMLETSTMYAEGEQSVAEGTHEYAKGHPTTLLFDHRQASEKWDLTKKSQRLEALVEAYGPAVEWMNLSAIADSFDDGQVSEAEFRRYWLNQPVPLEHAPQTILPNWLACLNDKAVSRPDPSAIGIAVSIDRAFASIGVAAGGETPSVGAVERRRGVRWVVDEAARIQSHYRIPVIVAAKGPAESLIERLEDAEIDVIRAGNDDYSAACERFSDAVAGGFLEHFGDDDLDDAVAAVQWRQIGDRRAFGRKSGDISMLEAATLASWGSTQDVASTYETRDLVTL